MRRPNRVGVEIMQGERGLGLFLLLIMMGCQPWGWTSRSEKAAVQPPPFPELKTVGTYTSFFGIEPIRVHGLGIVHNLPGTGSNPPPGPARQQAIHRLKQMGVSAPDEALASQEIALVQVSASIQPGAYRDDRIDVELEAMGDDKNVDLRGGTLLTSDLFEYADANQIMGKSNQGQRMLAHKKLVKAEGVIMPDMSDKASDPKRRGVVWSGGRVLENIPFDLIMNKEHQETRLAMLIATTINRRFHGKVQDHAMRGMADAQTKMVIRLRVPENYRLNWGRYLLVIRQVPIVESPQVLRELRRKYAEDLLNPDFSVVAALQLEALGQECAGELKRALKHHHPKVRFCAAEALAYLGDPSSAETLAETAKAFPDYRAYALTALASMDEAIAQIKLRELMTENEPELRYGAFRALQVMNARDRTIPCEVINQRFNLYRVYNDSPPMVHLCTRSYPDIVVFGSDPQLQPPFSLTAGPDFVLTAREGEDKCFISRISLQGAHSQDVASLKLTEIIRKMGAMGAHYGDVVELLQKANRLQNLSCPVAIDALPKAPSLETLAQQDPMNPGAAPTTPANKSLFEGWSFTPSLFANKRE